MRCDGEPVRPGMRTTRRMSRASQPADQNGTLSADTIRASGHVRPHQQAGHKTAPDQNAKNIEPTLAMREPSTQDIRDRLLEWPILTQAVIEPNIAVRQNRYDGGDHVTDS